jgi:MFS family permease
MSGALQASPNYKWLVVSMLWLVCFFNYADRQAIFSVFPLLRTEFRLTDVQLGIVAASFMWMYALFGPVAGWLCDRLDRKTLILGGLLFWSLVTAASALTHTYGQLILCRALGGLGEALYLPASMSLIGDYHGAATRSRAMSIHQSSVYVGTVAGGAISGFVAQRHGWRLSFILLGGLGILLGITLWKILREPMRGLSDRGARGERIDTPAGGSLIGELREVLSNRLVLILIAVFIGANFVAVIFLSWIPSFLYQKFHMSLSMAGLNGTVYLQIASVLGVLSGGLLADALARRPATRRSGRMLTQSIGLICGVPFLFFTGWTVSVPVLILSMIGLGYCKGLYDSNIFASLYDLVSIERRGIAAGLMNSLGWLGGGAAPVLIAIGAAKYGMSASISATAAIYLFFGLLLLCTARRLAV